MEQKSRSKFLPWPGFEPRTSHLAARQASTRQPWTSPSLIARILIEQFEINWVWFII